MSLKNYYATLGVPRSASPEDIKKAFRAAAKKYHPDTAPDNPFAEAHFRELQEAYETLSHPGRKARYDEECWLRGLYQRAERLTVSPEWILGEAKKLQDHMRTVDSYRMNHEALKEYVKALLSDQHLSVLQEAPQFKKTILETLLPSVNGLHFRYTPEVAERLLLLADGQETLVAIASEWKDSRDKEYYWTKARPLIVLGSAIAICLLIWLLLQ